MDKKEWTESFKRPEWQKRRLKILERDNWTCLLCGSKKKTLTVHHSYYDYKLKPWEYENYTLFTLCADCHEKEQKTVDASLSEIHDLLYDLPLLSNAYDCI